MDDWITNELSREMIEDVDRSKVISARIIDSPVLGAITPNELSGGVKTLIDIYKVPERVFNASACGDNCAKWILKIGEMQDITINLRHIMDFGDNTFTAKALNTNQTVHSMNELIPMNLRRLFTILTITTSLLQERDFQTCHIVSQRFTGFVSRENMYRCRRPIMKCIVYMEIPLLIQITGQIC